MNKISKIRLLSIPLTLVLTGLFYLPSLPQDRGNFSFATPKAKFIQRKAEPRPETNIQKTEIMPSSFNQKLLGSTGGILFCNTAVFNSSRTVNSIKINYNKLKPDGQRFQGGLQFTYQN